MTSTALRNLLSRKILYLAALTLVISACSTEGMEFNVSDQALTQDTSQAQAAENQNAQTDETSAEDTYTQDVIPPQAIARRKRHRLLQSRDARSVRPDQPRSPGAVAPRVTRAFRRALPPLRRAHCSALLRPSRYVYSRIQQAR